MNAVFASRVLRLTPTSYYARSRPLVIQYLRRRAICDTPGTSKVTDALQRTAAELANIHPNFESKLEGLSFAMAAYLAEEEVLLVLEPQLSEAIDCGDPSSHVLAAAAFLGDQKLVEALLRSGLNPNNASNLFGTPLQAAATNGQIETVRYLLRNGAGVNHFPRYRPFAKKTPIDGVSMPYTALQAAAEGGYGSLVRLFCAPEYGLLKSGKEYSNAIVAAARGGHEAIVDYLMQEGTEFGISELRICILQEALWNGNIQLVSAMLDAGADVNDNSCGLVLPLNISASQGHDEIVRLLLARGARLEDRSDSRTPPLSSAAITGWIQTARTLLEYGADINGGWPAAVVLSAEREHPNMTIFLLEQGASLNRINSDIDAFLAFISWDCVSLLRLLVSYGLDVHKGAARTDDDLAKECSPMHIALKARKFGIVQLLEENAVRPMVYLNGVFSWKDVGAA